MLPIRSLTFALALLLAALPRGQSAAPVTWEHDVGPLLGERCVSCHGPWRQRKSLRLDSRAGVLAGGRSGPAVVPGQSQRSLLLWHVTGTRGRKRMPAEGEPLTEAQIALLGRWVDAGAPGPDDESPAGRTHWAYRRIERPAVPEAPESTWPRGDLDRLVLGALAREGLTPGEEADRATWLRRASLDLTGLPPELAELDAFLADASPDAYERATGRLLASPGYGERWAALWLDLARYADTQGYEKDPRRTIWRWRDWVIDAFAADMPFDRFTELQLAGDLLPGAGTQERIATAFHRNTMTNDEGGTDDEEFRVEAVVDRVDTTLSVWMGTTFGCARCHDHKYDPLSQREYYQLFAFLNQTEDSDKPDERPTLAAYTPEQEQERAALLAVRAGLQGVLGAPLPELDAAEQAWVQAQQAQVAAIPPSSTPWSYAGPFAFASMEQALAEGAAPESGWTEKPEWEDGKVWQLGSAPNAAHWLRRTVSTPQARDVTLSLGSDDGIALWVNGKEVLRHAVGRGPAPDQERVTVALRAGSNALLLKIANGGGPSGFYCKLLAVDLPDDSLAALAAPERTPEQQALLTRAYRARAPQLAPVRDALAEVDASIARIAAPTVPILRELPDGQRRATHVLARGSFLSPGEAVEPGVPAAFPPLPADAPRNRLGLARWLTSRDNPLTARVLANRLWEELWGRGLVETSDDFGSAGEPPSHPELLDWLACELLERGWSIRALLRTIVLSATYRQSSRGRPELEARDPHNRLLARGPRVRLSAEAIRDQALLASGLLSRKRLGPSVMPPQPPGLWQNIYSQDQWQDAQGEDRYRRAVYTFWRRTNPYPAMTTFDAPSREHCVVKRVRTNTPLQALVTLNDPAFVEMAQALARRVVREAGPDASSRVTHAFRLCVARAPRPAEAARLLALLGDELARWRERPADAVEMATEPLGALSAGNDAAELAAWTVVAQVLLNLDETLTKG